MTANQKPLSRETIIAWALCLTALAVGARNFEESLSVDAPLYAAIARNIARTGEWFRMDGGIPDFAPFFEHPHLGFWLIASVFKVLPAADWSARIVGHVFYFAFLCLFFLWVRARSGEKTAIWTILLMWAWDRVSSFFSSAYLDPAALFFGTAALVALDRGKPRRSKALAGFFLGLCVMTKGLTVLGFLPAALVILVLAKKPFRENARDVGLMAAGFFGVVFSYALALKLSNVPNFAALYFGRQLTGRLNDEWFFARFFKPSLWFRVLRDSHFLAPLAFLAIPKLRREPTLFIPLALFGAFLTMYGCAGLGGNQYWITVFPWLGWLIAAGALSRLDWNPRPLVRITSVLALVGLFVAQYAPIRIHGSPPSPEVEALRTLKKAGAIDRVVVDAFPVASHFGFSSVYSWYVDVPIAYPKLEAPSPAEPRTGYVLLTAVPYREAQLQTAGYCATSRHGDRSVWLPCKP